MYHDTKYAVASGCKDFSVAMAENFNSPRVPLHCLTHAEATTQREARRPLRAREALYHSMARGTWQVGRN